LWTFFYLLTFLTNPLNNKVYYVLLNSKSYIKCEGKIKRFLVRHSPIKEANHIKGTSHYLNKNKVPEK